MPRVEPAIFRAFQARGSLWDGYEIVYLAVTVAEASVALARRDLAGGSRGRGVAQTGAPDELDPSGWRVLIGLGDGGGQWDARRLVRLLVSAPKSVVTVSFISAQRENPCHGRGRRF